MGMMSNSGEIFANSPETFPFEDLQWLYEVNKCAEWIRTNSFKTVCLQFPDQLLGNSSQISLSLQEKLGQTIYVLADTAYSSCCIDYVAAAHINADAIIHFGPTCLSATSGAIPYLNIYEKFPFDIDEFHEKYTETFSSQLQGPQIILDTPYIYLQDQFRRKFPGIPTDPIDSTNLNLEGKPMVFVSDKCQHKKIPSLKYHFQPSVLYYYENRKLVCYELDPKVTRRRYYLMEKIKDSRTIGIVIGTLGVKNYLEIIDRLKKLIQLHKKKYYLVSVGKPTVAKLANFPEIDIYVLVTCAMNHIYDNRDFYRPIVTPYEMEVALNPASDQLSFTYDFDRFVSLPISEAIDQDGRDVSLITGNVRQGCVDDIQVNSSEVALKTDGAVALPSTHGAGFFLERTWRGLEQNLGAGDVKMAEEGQHGIAQQYTNEIA